MTVSYLCKHCGKPLHYRLKSFCSWECRVLGNRYASQDQLQKAYQIIQENLNRTGRPGYKTAARAIGIDYELMCRYWNRDHPKAAA